MNTWTSIKRVKVNTVCNMIYMKQRVLFKSGYTNNNIDLSKSKR